MRQHNNLFSLLIISVFYKNRLSDIENQQNMYQEKIIEKGGGSSWAMWFLHQ